MRPQQGEERFGGKQPGTTGGKDVGSGTPAATTAFVAVRNRRAGGRTRGTRAPVQGGPGARKVARARMEARGLELAQLEASSCGRPYRGGRRPTCSRRRSSNPFGVLRPWGFAREWTEVAANRQRLLSWPRNLPPSTPNDWYSFPMDDSLRDESHAYSMHNELDKYPVQDWTLHRISTELHAQGYGVRHLCQDECHSAPALSHKLLDHAAQLCDWKWGTVLVVRRSAHDVRAGVPRAEIGARSRCQGGRGGIRGCKAFGGAP